jgi:hypothetical protein
MELSALKCPIGTYLRVTAPSTDELNNWISDLEALPSRLSEVVSGLSATELNYIYRPEGWTIQQVVHHLADSHMNSIIRFKLALTEDTPTIRPYLEDKWAELADVRLVDVRASITILEGVHQRLTALLRSLSEDELQRSFVHPEHNRKITIAENIGLYAWHSNHHLAHILQALKFKGKF